MTTIAHLSDLHFGTVRPQLADGALAALTELRPDLIVVSGDLTQQGSSREYRAARQFLSALPGPLVVVPGNHDIPTYNLIQRFLHPLKKFQRHIASQFPAVQQTDGVTALGINTARRFPWTNGRVSYDQMEHIRDYFCTRPAEEWKILVTHHPFVAPPDHPKRPLVGCAAKTLQAIRACQLDLVLAGHVHMSYASGTHAVYTAVNPSLLVIQAGTALSSRTRDEANAFNVLTLHDDRALDVAVWMWDSSRFAARRVHTYTRREGHWTQQAVS